MADDSLIPASPPPAEFTEETARKIISVTTRDLEIRAQELEFRREELAQSAQFAEKALAAQAEDLKDGRRHSRSSARDRYIFIGIVMGLLIVFAGWAMYLDKEQIVLQVLQVIGPLLIGFGSGYLYRGRQQPAPNNVEPES